MEAIQNRASLHLKLNISELILSFVGAAISGTLYWAHRHNVLLPCTASGGCETVAQSRWAHVTIGPWHDIPLALVGLFGYVVLLTATMIKLGSENAKTICQVQTAMLLVAAFGFVYSWYLQYVSHFLLNAFCPYCFSSACTMTILFFVISWNARLLRKPVALKEIGTP